MKNGEAVFLAVSHMLSDSHVNVQDLFEREEEKELVKSLIDNYEQKLKGYEGENITDTYKKLAVETLKSILISREMHQRFSGEDWGSPYIDVGQWVKDE